LVRAYFYLLPARGKITCKFKDELKTSFLVFGIAVPKRNACYVNQEITCLREKKGACDLQATSSRKLLAMKTFQQKLIISLLYQKESQMMVY